MNLRPLNSSNRLDIIEVYVKNAGEFDFVKKNRNNFLCRPPRLENFENRKIDIKSEIFIKI
jgi:hypothetical protein